MDIIVPVHTYVKSSLKPSIQSSAASLQLESDIQRQTSGSLDFINYAYSKVILGNNRIIE